MNEDETVRSNLYAMSPYYFEHLVADVWEAQGWSATVTTNSKDFGIDVVVERADPYDQKQIIQAKNYSEGNLISGPEIREIAGLHHQESNTDLVIAVTSSSFTKNAREVAKRSNVKLIDGGQFAEMIIENSCEQSVRRYVDMTIIEDESKSERAERLYGLYSRRSSEIEKPAHKPGRLELYFEINGALSSHYNHIANTHGLSGLTEMMANRTEEIARREEMSMNWHRKSKPYSISISCPRRYTKGTKEHMNYHFDITIEILDGVYDIGIENVDWAIVKGFGDICFTWTDV